MCRRPEKISEEKSRQLGHHVAVYTNKTGKEAEVNVPHGHNFVQLSLLTDPPSAPIPSSRRASKSASPPPAHRGVDTSESAAASVAEIRPTRKQTTLELIRAAGSRGLTNHEIVRVTGWLMASTTPITNGLVRDGKIVDSQERRDSPSGLPCKVWVAVERRSR
jgi:hypothetical protein